MQFPCPSALSSGGLGSADMQRTTLSSEHSGFPSPRCAHRADSQALDVSTELTTKLWPCPQSHLFPKLSFCSTQQQLEEQLQCHITHR